MASPSQVNICNLSLLAIGARAQVSSITPSDGSVPANACATLFSFVFQELARIARWGCLKKQTTLTLIQAAQGTPENPTGTSLPLPQQPWLYAYLYPSDCLLMREILPPLITSGTGQLQTSLSNSVTPNIPGQFQIPYATGYSTDSSGNALEVVLTNQESAVANYTVDQENPASWDSLFTSAYVASLAAYLVPALSLDKQFMTIQIGLAEKYIGIARGMDGNETPTIQNHVPDWIRARMGATGLSTGYGYNAYGNIGSMAWPS